MKISKRALRRIIKEEKSKLLKEGKTGHAIGLGFVGWEPNQRTDFAKAYGKDARSIGAVHHQASLSEQPAAVGSTDPVENAYQELKYSGAYKDLQEVLHDVSVKLEDLYSKHAEMMIQADQESILRNLDDVMEEIDNLRSTFSSLR
jgi:hypothetical protein